MSDVFITEIGGAGRWQQASVTFKFVHAFFGGAPQNVTSVLLKNYNSAGSLTSSQSQVAIYKPASFNWAFELPGFEGVAYPGKATRPIGVFRRMATGGFAYEVLMPKDTPYGPVAALLAAKNKEQKGRLRRAVMTVPDLAGAWPNSTIVKVK